MENKETTLSEEIIHIRPVPMPMISFNDDKIPVKKVKEFIRQWRKIGLMTPEQDYRFDMLLGKELSEVKDDTK